jgi:hypothetical protein
MYHRKPAHPQTLADNRRRSSFKPEPNMSAVKLASLSASPLSLDTMLQAQEAR